MESNPRTQVNDSKAKTQVEGRHEPLLDLAVLRIYIRQFFSKHFVLCCVASVSVALYFDPFFDPPELEVTATHLCARVDATSFKGGGLKLLPGINEQRLDGGAAIVYVENMPNNSGEEVWVTAAELAQNGRGTCARKGYLYRLTACVLRSVPAV